MVEYAHFIQTVMPRIGWPYLGVTLVAFLFFYVFFKDELSHCKIQDRFPTHNEYLRDVLYSISSIVVFTVVTLVAFKVFGSYSKIYMDFEQHSMSYYVLSFVLMFFAHDAYFYWMHRLLHRPKLFRLFHRAHHKSTNPSPWTAYAFHPMEAILEGMIIPLMTFIVPIHISVLGLIMAIQVGFNVYGHLGYEILPLNFRQTLLGRYINSSVSHNLHHEKFRGNYGLYTLIWDRAFGTLREDYDETCACLDAKRRSAARAKGRLLAGT
jgi:sterol desaturase/sphingolipid hydroxylase (fatty acid hydroxylase superfamily)